MSRPCMSVNATTTVSICADSTSAFSCSEGEHGAILVLEPFG